jgi:hypothetical protein
MFASRIGYESGITKLKSFSLRLTIATCLVCAFRMCACSHVAQSPFTGTWKTSPDQSEFSPLLFTFSLSNGRYDCVSCVPKVLQIKADGSEQPLPGLLHYKIAVNEIDSHTVRIINTRDGKSFSEEVCTAVNAAHTLHCKTTNHLPEDDKPLVGETEWERVGETIPDANAASGSWRMQKWILPADQSLKTFNWNGSDFTASSPAGVRWTAKFDGKDYPVKGSYAIDSVSLRRTGDRAIEATYKLGGHLIRVDKMTVSPDGKTLTTVAESERTGRVNIVLAIRQ